jgi:hypothetical protein
MGRHNFIVHSFAQDVWIAGVLAFIDRAVVFESGQQRIDC